MKPSPTTATTRPEPPVKSSIHRAMQYAANAMLSTILRRYYRALARSLKLRDPVQAAINDYLKHERQVRDLNKSANTGQSPGNKL